MATVLSTVMATVIPTVQSTADPGGGGTPPVVYLQDNFNDTPGTNVDVHISDVGGPWFYPGLGIEWVIDATGTELGMVTGTNGPQFTSPSTNVKGVGNYNYPLSGYAGIKFRNNQTNLNSAPNIEVRQGINGLQIRYGATVQETVAAAETVFELIGTINGPNIFTSMTGGASISRSDAPENGVVVHGLSGFAHVDTACLDIVFEAFP